MRVVSIRLFTSLLLLGACGDVPVPELALDLTRLDSIEPNDSQLNGLTVNGLTVNGLTVNGLTVNGSAVAGSGAAAPSATTRPNDLAGVRFSSLTLGGVSLSRSWLNQSTLEASRRGTSYSGAQLVGATLEGRLIDGTTLPLRIEDVQSADGVSLYSVSILADTGPVPLCGLSGGNPVPAIAVLGYWDRSASYVEDSSYFTFGCVSAAIGKCALWGYKPWASASECRSSAQCSSRALSDWHRACVRLVRADYCGDGVSHTRSGTRINVYDQLGIQLPASAGWAIESEWRPDGAQCINHTRWLRANAAQTETDLAYVQRVCPDRLSVNRGSRCDADKSSFNTQVGFYRSAEWRSLIRNDSPQYQ
ncbi:MAG: hypothetical protein JNM40_26335 [Myxococcales bacterium]|nr:hypothetical protein [Myxococcales bacterium]